MNKTINSGLKYENDVKLFKTANQATLNTIKHRHQKSNAAFLFASQPVFVESAQAAYLLSEYINAIREKETKEIYKTFFCSSRVEALHGAIKNARHNARENLSASDGMVLVYDQQRYYGDLFNPLSKYSNEALVSGVCFYDSETDLFQQLHKPSVPASAVVFCLASEVNIDTFNKVQKDCKDNNTILIIDTSNVSDSQIEVVISRMIYSPDIVVWGEALTDHQVPFGAFSVLDKHYRVWGTFSTCFIHSSTYGGNSLVTSIARDRLLEKLTKTTDIAVRLQKIANEMAERMNAFQTFINPMTPLIYKAARLDLDIVSAKGSKIIIKDQYGENINLIDCIGGAGSNLRGYNPDDIGKVLDEHQSNMDYWQKLADLLFELTGLEKAFPAVSGACAVDIAISMAMLANSEKTRILVFKGNYAGKTLISLNGSEEEFDRKPFLPLYFDVVYLDVFSSNAEVTLVNELQSGKIALVWLEVMQGNSLIKVPVRIMDLIFKYKKDYGYFVGVDEILNGMYRTGDFVSYNRDQYKPDILTLSKGLSDLTFPISATLVTNEIYQPAKSVNESLVTRYESLFLNQLGAHIAFNGLTKANQLYSNGRVKKAGDYLKTELSKIAERSPYLKTVRGEGLHLHLVLDMEKFPLSLFGKDISELLISRLCLSKGHVLQYFCRLLPPLNISDAELRELTSGIENALAMNRFYFFLFGLKHLAIFGYLLMSTKMKFVVAKFLNKVVGKRTN